MARMMRGEYHRRPVGPRYPVDDQRLVPEAEGRGGFVQNQRIGLGEHCVGEDRNRSVPVEAGWLGFGRKRGVCLHVLLAALLHLFVILALLRASEVAVPQQGLAAIAVTIVPEPLAMTEGKATNAQAAQDAVTPATPEEPPPLLQAMPALVPPDAGPAPAAVAPSVAVPAETPSLVGTSASPVAQEPPLRSVTGRMGRVGLKRVAQEHQGIRAAPRRLQQQQAASSGAEPAADHLAAVSTDAVASDAPSWESQVGAWLQAHKHYPETARTRGDEGTVSLRFVVGRDGRVLDVSLARSSGFAELDDAGVAMLRNAQVPPLPASLPQPQLAVTVALRYTLAR